LLVAVSVVVLSTSCTAPARLDRVASPSELQRLRLWLQSDVELSWSGSGWARIESPDGEFEGNVQLNVDAPRRARFVLESGGLFGMVSERVAVALPGDGWVVTHQKRNDQLEREPFADSRLRHWLPLGQPQDLFALSSGLPPWPHAQDWEALWPGARIIASEKKGRILTYRLLSEAGDEAYLLRLDENTLQAFEWWADGERRLRIEYDDWQTQDGLERPATLRLAAPQTSVKAELKLDEWRQRRDWTAADFEVY
jgi:outer membrane biogenesis lipoprotein LolB